MYLDNHNIDIDKRSLTYVPKHGESKEATG